MQLIFPIRLNLADTQVVLIDDGSTDNSLEICREYKADNVIIASYDNCGLSIARNHGIELAEGEWILFLDSDDILLFKGYSELILQIASSSSDILVGKIVLYYENGRRVWPDYSFYAACTVLDIYERIPPPMWNAVRFICRREFLLENDLLFEPGILCEDAEWSPRMLKTVKSVEFCEEPFYGYYYNRTGSLTNRNRVERLCDIHHIAKKSFALYKDEPYAPILFARLVHDCYASLSAYYASNERRELRTIIFRLLPWYRYSDARYIRVFGKIARFIPLYFFSVLLYGAKSIRRRLISKRGAL